MTQIFFFHLNQVTRANIHFMRKLVENGATQHPGANFIVQQNTKIKKYEDVLVRVSQCFRICTMLFYHIYKTVFPLQPYRNVCRSVFFSVEVISSVLLFRKQKIGYEKLALSSNCLGFLNMETDS